MVKHHRSKHTKKRSRSVKRSFKCGKKVKKQTRKTKTKIKTKNIVTYKKCGGNANSKFKHIPMAFSSTGDKVVYGESFKMGEYYNHDSTGKHYQYREIPVHYAYVMCALANYSGKYYGECVSSSGAKRKKMWHYEGSTVRSVALRPARQDDKNRDVENDKNRDVENTVVVTGSDDGLVRIWTQFPTKDLHYDSDALHKDELRMTPANNFRRQIIVSSVAFSPDGTKVVAGYNDGTVRIWTEHEDHEAKKHLYNWTGWASRGNDYDNFSVEKGEVNSVVFNHDGTKVVAGYDDGTARIWEVKDKRAPRRRKTTEPMMIMMHNSSSNSVAFSPNGEKVVAGYQDGTVIIWDVKPVEEPAITSAEPAIASAGTDDNTNANDGVQVDNTNANDGVQVDIASEKNNVEEPAITSVDPAITSGKNNINGGWLRMPNFFPNKKKPPPSPPAPSYPLAKCLKKIKGHSTNVTSLAFSPDGTKVVSGSDDKTVHIWDVVSGKTVHILDVASGVQLKKIPVDNSPVDNSHVDNSPVAVRTVAGRIVDVRTVSSVAFTDDDNVIFGYHYYERYKTNTKIVCIFNVSSGEITPMSIVSD